MARRVCGTKAQGLFFSNLCCCLLACLPSRPRFEGALQDLRLQLAASHQLQLERVEAGRREDRALAAERAEGLARWVGHCREGVVEKRTGDPTALHGSRMLRNPCSAVGSAYGALCRAHEQRLVAARAEAAEERAALGRLHQRELEALRDKYETGQVRRGLT